MLKFKNFKVNYKESNILQEFNLEIQEGEVLVISGCSGSGKSTLIRTINGIIPEITSANLSGEILLNGKNLLNLSIGERSSYISTVFQNPKSQFFCIDSTDEIAFALENRNIPREKILKTIAEYTKLLNTEKLLGKNIFNLSGGEKQMVAITATSCMDNKIYLFDEPSASLDRESIELLKNAIVKLKSMGKIIIIAEHRLYYLRDLMDKLCIIKNKKLDIYRKEDLKKENFANISTKNHLRTFYPVTKGDICKENHIKINMFQNKDMSGDLLCKDYFLKYNAEKVFDFSISFKPGINYIIGKNGVGKTSFIKLLTKLQKGKRKNYYQGKNIKKEYDYISLVMQDVNYQLFTDSVWKEISIVSDNDFEKDELLKDLNLFEKKDFHPHTLSGGEKQRLLVGMAKISKKPIVILDEPTSGLCKKQMEIIISYLQEMKETGKIIIIITHDYEFIKKCNGTVFEFIK